MGLRESGRRGRSRSCAGRADCSATHRLHCSLVSQTVVGHQSWHSVGEAKRTGSSALNSDEWRRSTAAIHQPHINIICGDDSAHLYCLRPVSHSPSTGLIIISNGRQVWTETTGRGKQTHNGTNLSIVRFFLSSEKKKLTLKYILCIYISCFLKTNTVKKKKKWGNMHNYSKQKRKKKTLKWRKIKKIILKS